MHTLYSRYLYYQSKLKDQLSQFHVLLEDEIRKMINKMLSKRENKLYFL